MLTTAGTSLQSTGKKKKRRNKHRKKGSSNSKLAPKDEHDDESPTKQPLPKRSHSDNDQDSEDEQVVKKKKKKIKPVPVEPGKKGAKSIRQMKREKHAARLAEAENVAKDAHKLQCLHYLSQWKHDKVNWKFMKAKQLWLYKHKFSVNHIPDDSWSTFLEYFSSANGNIKNMLLEDANKVIAKMDECLEKEQNDNNQEEESVEQKTNSEEKPDEVTYNRARDIIQHLHE